MRFEGVLKTWNDDRGFGFIEPKQGGQEVFVHIKAFPSGTGRPVPNMAVNFELEPTSDGKKRARNVLISRPTKGYAQNGFRTTAANKLGKANLVVLIGFALLFALVSIIWRTTQFFAIAYLLMSLVTFGAYWNDKSAAKSGSWRTSEGTLHTLGLMCGWPGAIVAQQIFRHKTTKAEFRLVFWTTVILNIAIFLALTTPLLRLIVTKN